MTATTPKPRTCKRCNGSGEYRGYGKCYGCHGHGVLIPAEVESPEDRAEYDEIQAHRAHRAAEREARRAVR